MSATRNQSIEEMLIKDIEDAINGIEEKHNYDAIQSVKDDLKLLKISFPSIPNPEIKKDIQERIKKCETRISLIDKKSTVSSSKARLFKTHQDTLQILENSQKQLAEMEEVGAGILTELDKQKTTIKHSKENLTKVHEQLNTSTGLLNQMSKWWRG